jgi:hypothetical protein
MTNDKPFDFACAGYGWYTVKAENLNELTNDNCIRILCLYEMLSPERYTNMRIFAEATGFYQGRRAIVGWAYYE